MDNRHGHFDHDFRGGAFFVPYVDPPYGYYYSPYCDPYSAYYYPPYC